MTNDQSPVNETPQRAAYETPVVIELNLGEGTDGKPVPSLVETSTSGPS
jgi:hypothetical protein